MRGKFAYSIHDPNALTKENIEIRRRRKKGERIPLAEAVPIVRCPSPSLLPLLPQGPR